MDTLSTVGTDVTMQCEGTKMIATMSREYIKANEQWLGNGEYVMMGISDITQSPQDAADCKGTQLDIIQISSAN